MDSEKTCENMDSLIHSTRGKNWCDEEIEIFVQVLRKNFASLQGRGRKVKIYARMACQLKDLGIDRTAKEIQNKYKSMLTEYRNAASLKHSDVSPSTYKWFGLLDECMRIVIQNTNESNPTEVQDEIGHSNFANGIFDSEGPSNLPEMACSTSQLYKPSSSDFGMMGTMSPASPQAKKRRLDSNTTRLVEVKDIVRLQNITEEIKQHREISTQVQEKLCDSLETFTQLIKSLNGTLSLIPTLLTQLMQRPPNQYSYVTQSNLQPGSFIVSPNLQNLFQQGERGANTQYFWVANPVVSDEARPSLTQP